MTNNAPPNKRNESGRTREESVEAVFYPDCMQKVFKTHLYYEIGRLLEMYKLLLEPKRYAGLSAELVRTLDDALIVGFCTHARNLMEFFFRTRNNSHEYAI